jgi:hypothetical protein
MSAVIKIVPQALTSAGFAALAHKLYLLRPIAVGAPLATPPNAAFPE